jgi:hypothetical protein
MKSRVRLGGLFDGVVWGRRHICRFSSTKGQHAKLCALRERPTNELSFSDHVQDGGRWWWKEREAKGGEGEEATITSKPGQNLVQEKEWIK